MNDDTPYLEDGFSSLTPDVLLNAVEKEVGERLTGLTSPLPSYINRVYELLAFSGKRYVVKFYRPGRWKKEAIEDEHRFMMDCVENDIPVVPPLSLSNGHTLGNVGGIYFAVFEKRSGREMELNTDDDWKRVGTLLGRVHMTGSSGASPHRVHLHPEKSLRTDIEWLLSGNDIPPHMVKDVKTVLESVHSTASQAFAAVADADIIRLHGDCHLKNFLSRDQEGLLIIDFDDMATGPAVQDIWLLLPDRVDNCRKEFNLLLSGYEQFRDFDDRTLWLVEPLRAMRMIYFLAWCSRQKKDYRFKTLFPDWGSENFWRSEMNDLTRQLNHMQTEKPKGNW
ncbi:stress response kinase A [Desulfoluna limicola]|uniref:Stress response kinase A n=1 Tax=Desulfoluna limicola TaxID=2810562 RepID=A0ABM7PP50_9BACT|nr:serine/threonine protein kinase [Desulfoluna limicola]BCS98823.1 stress response kinase A [Desulfoluna limicola]